MKRKKFKQHYSNHLRFLELMADYNKDELFNFLKGYKEIKNPNHVDNKRLSNEWLNPTQRMFFFEIVKHPTILQDVYRKVNNDLDPLYLSDDWLDVDLYLENVESTTGQYDINVSYDSKTCQGTYTNNKGEQQTMIKHTILACCHPDIEKVFKATIEVLSGQQNQGFYLATKYHGEYFTAKQIRKLEERIKLTRSSIDIMQVMQKDQSKVIDLLYRLEIELNNLKGDLRVFKNEFHDSPSI
ncbi:MAG: hypothetical protein ACRCXZ_00865 [Patescibacteria group bacterium]